VQRETPEEGGMTEKRERELISHLSGISSLDELEAFRDAIISDGETLSSGLLAEMAGKIFKLSRSKGRAR
jgi:hypothetical protein